MENEILFGHSNKKEITIYTSSWKTNNVLFSEKWLKSITCGVILFVWKVYKKKEREKQKEDYWFPVLKGM